MGLPVSPHCRPRASLTAPLSAVILNWLLLTEWHGEKGCWWHMGDKKGSWATP